MLRTINPVDEMTIDLLDFWRCHECRYLIIFVVAHDLLTLEHQSLAIV